MQLSRLSVMRSIPCLALFLLAGCAEPPTDFRYTSGCMTEIESEVELHPWAVDLNVNVARRMLLESEVVKSNEEFCAAFGSLRVRIFNRESLDGRQGNYDLFGGVSLTGNMNGLLHEMLHALQTVNWQPGTAWHEDWEAKGFHSLDRRYGYYIHDPRR